MAPHDFDAILTRKLNVLYPDSSLRTAADAVLAKYEGSARVKVAALKLAGTDLRELERLILTAEQDFRDVLASAEYPRQLEAGFGASNEGLEAEDLAEYESWLKS